MSIPYFSLNVIDCDECSGEIYHGYEFLRIEDLNFCQDSCFTDYILKNGAVKKMHLTNEMIGDIKNE